MSYLRIKIDDNFSKPLAKKLKQAGVRAAHALAVQIAKDTTPFVPASGAPAGLYNRAQVVDNMIIYPGPYARYLYYGKVMVDAATGKGPMKIMKDGQVVAIRFRKGATLKQTDKPLDIKKHHHHQATDHWLKASKAQNLEKWVRVAGKAVEHELGK